MNTTVSKVKNELSWTQSLTDVSWGCTTLRFHIGVKGQEGWWACWQMGLGQSYARVFLPSWCQLRQRCVCVLVSSGISAFIVSSFQRKFSWECGFIKSFAADSGRLMWNYKPEVIIFIWLSVLLAVLHPQPSQSRRNKSPTCETHWWFIHVTLRLELWKTQPAVCCGFHEVLNPVKIKPMCLLMW